MLLAARGVNRAERRRTLPNAVGPAQESIKYAVLARKQAVILSIEPAVNDWSEPAVNDWSKIWRNVQLILDRRGPKSHNVHNRQPASGSVIADGSRTK